MKLKFEPNQQYQLDAINAVVDIFTGQPKDSDGANRHMDRGRQLSLEATIAKGNSLTLDAAQIIKNTHKIQEKNGIEKSETKEGGFGIPMTFPLEISEKSLKYGMNFSIEMETGTGKTYVYLRTIHELHQHYGWKKFIIVVPSVAIREGVLKNLAITREHFADLYNKPEMDYYVWDSKKTGQAREFATNDTLQIMVITIDSFAKAQNVMNRQSDYGRPLDFIKATHPVVILDEPQNMETDIRRNAIASLSPLCTLRYSATHKHLYNLLYRLTPVDAYDKGLVKKIEVHSVQSEDNYNDAYINVLSLERQSKTRSFAKIEVDASDEYGLQRKTIKAFPGDDLEAKTGRSVYAGYYVESINHGDDCVEFSNGKVVYVGQRDESLHDDIIKRQIELTIDNHFDKQRRLGSGVKVLSLFFIDKVANYREYIANGAQKGKFAKWFEEAYAKVASKPKYAGVMDGLSASEVHDGYFAADKSGQWKDSRDTKGEGGRTKDDDTAYNLIMKDKERLLDTGEPLRFIFSHSALKEGWDNPNVFQICMMRESGSENDRRQTIGRGLRLPVRQDGTRVFDEQINQLMVVANESYRDFANNLQREYKKAGVKIGFVRRSEFARIVLHDDPNSTLGHQSSNEIWECLRRRSMIDDEGRVLANFAPNNIGFTLDLPDDLQKYHAEVVDIIEGCKIDKFVKDARKKEKIRPNKEVLYSPLLEELWKRISHKTTYRVVFDNGQIIMAAINAIKAKPELKPLRIEVKRHRVLLKRGGVHNDGMVGEATHDLAGTFELPDIISELQDSTGLTRRTIVDILISSGRLHEFLKNPYDYVQMVKSAIKSVLAQVVVDGVEYEKMGERSYELRNFQKDSDEEVERFIDRLYQVKNQQKTVTDRLALDSATEQKFAEYLDSREDIKLFLKLPSKFTIPTPVGDYNPDWAIVKEVNGVEKIYMVRETKNGGEREDELHKIACAKKHFETIGMRDYAKSTPDDWRV